MKRLIVCCDGTWQNLERPYPTNVVKMAQGIEPIAKDGVPQVVFYHEGLGTGGNTKVQKKMDRVAGGGLGKGIEKTIQDGYRFLSLNYSPGDGIYLFGFSRGAYTVRSLAAFMSHCGLLSRRHIRQIDEAYLLYYNHLNLNKIDPAKLNKLLDLKIDQIKQIQQTNPSKLLEIFRQKYSFKTPPYGDRIPITLLGCWDTVGSLGVPDLIPFLNWDKKINQKYEYLNVIQLSPIVENALHAVAIDEQRTTFQDCLMEKNQTVPHQRLIQKWFPGDHGCVGGGSEEQSGLSDGALQWMVDAINELEIPLDINLKVIPTGVAPQADSDYQREETGIIDKITRLIGQQEREVPDDINALHESVIKRWISRPDYRPNKLREKHGTYLDQVVLSPPLAHCSVPSRQVLTR